MESVILKRPGVQSYPLIISVPHAGTQIPEELMESFVSTDPLLLTRDSDLYVDELYAAALGFGIPLIVQPYNRYVIDLNRDQNNVDASFVEGAIRLDNPQYIGLVAHKTTHAEPLLKRPLTRDELAGRIAKYYTPFHTTLKSLIDETKKKFGYCIHIDAHSMPAKAAEGHADQGERADVVPGDREGTSCRDTLTQTIVKYFKNQGLSCVCNNPYQGGFITQNYGRPSENIHTIQIELNRRLYMDEQTHARIPEKFAGLQSLISGLIQELIVITKDWENI